MAVLQEQSSDAIYLQYVIKVLLYIIDEIHYPETITDYDCRARSQCYVGMNQITVTMSACITALCHSYNNNPK